MHLQNWKSPNPSGNLKLTFDNNLLSTRRLECDRQLIATRFSYKWNISTGIWRVFYSILSFLFLTGAAYFNMHSSHYLACHVETAQNSNENANAWKYSRKSKKEKKEYETSKKLAGFVYISTAFFHPSFRIYTYVVYTLLQLRSFHRRLEMQHCSKNK